MLVDAEARKVINRITNNCRLLYAGYDESVEYKVDVSYHVETCKYYQRTTMPRASCECPVVREDRGKTVKRPGLLDQLQEFQQNKDTDRNPQSERQAPRVKKVKYMAELNGFFALDEIMSEINRDVDRWLEEAERDRTWAAQPVKLILMGLPGQVQMFAESRPDLMHVIDKRLADWVARSRSALKITVGDAIFESVVCGNCGGGLASPWGNRGESSVVCVGKPDSPPCGHSYPMNEWMDLYEGRS